MDAVVDILSEKGLLVESEGAQVVNLEKYGIEHPALIKKSDGATLYITRDLAAALYRKNEYQFAKSIYVVGQEQSAHFKQLKSCLERNGLRLGVKTLLMFLLVWLQKKGRNSLLVKGMSSC